MISTVERLKRKAENTGIESITYREQARIALYLANEYDEMNGVYEWFEDRYDLGYPRERTEEHLKKIMDLYSDSLLPS